MRLQLDGGAKSVLDQLVSIAPATNHLCWLRDLPPLLMMQSPPFLKNILAGEAILTIFSGDTLAIS
jgi:hypothetical protein